MKRVGVIFGLVLAAFAAGAETPSYKQWEDDIAAFEAADRAAPPPTNAVLFIGSSNIRMWNTLAEDFSEYPVIQRGFGGCRLSDVAHFADRIAIPYRPRLIVVSAGGNDLHAGLPPEAVFASFTQFVGTVRTALPGTRIAYVSISPCRSRWSETAAMKEVNARIKAFVEAGTNLDFISTFEAMLGADGKPISTYFLDDQLHHNRKGNRVRADIIRPHLAPPGRPNIVVILVDDMGFSDIGCYGSEIPTPNLDRLAAGGLRFTQFYNTGRCCPTRASLLTGLYPHQTGVGHMNGDRGAEGYRGDLNNHCVTIADVLRGAGYRTSMAGKWHVTKYVAPIDPAKRFNWPLQRGFDNYFGIINGGADYFRPADLVSGNEIAKPADGFYTTDAFVDHAIQFTGEGDRSKPFFLYLAFNAPHFPLMAPAEEIAKFRGTYKAGWDRLREQRHAKQIEMGLLDPAWPLAPRPEAVKAWDSLTPEQQDRFDHIMAIYAACLSHVDTAIGRLVDALRQRGELDNTLLFFLSDNGGNYESGPDGRLDGDNPGGAGSNVFCGQSWATLQNTPFRRYKHHNHEGGISTPLIVHWPAGVRARGELRTQPGHLIDLMPTCVEVSGARYPSEFHNAPILPMEGRSLLPAFANRSGDRGPLFWEHEGNAAIRSGDWKLVRKDRNGAWELYDLAHDRTELHDLAAAQPGRVQALREQWDAWAQRAHVLPYPTGKN